MKLKENTILITGGATGIGLAIAERFLSEGNKVIVIGRREEKLKEAQDRFPDLIIKQCDVATEKERLELFDWVVKEHAGVNVLINNAAIQRSINMAAAKREWSEYGQEIAINLDAPIHLSMLFAPYFIKQGGGTIVNVSSRLGIVPAGWVPIYTATKGGLHLFTQALRMQMEGKNVNVVEILPPMVATDLAGVGNQADGTPVDVFADAVMEKFREGVQEIGYGTSEVALSDDFNNKMVRDEGQRMWKLLSAKLPMFQ